MVSFVVVIAIMMVITTTTMTAFAQIGSSGENVTSGSGSNSSGGVTILSQSLVEILPGLPAVIGELRNDSPNRVSPSLIHGKFYDSSGQLLYLGTGSAVGLVELRPGEKTPFQVSINDDSVLGRLANYSIIVEPSTYIQNKPAALIIEVSKQGLTAEGPCSGTCYKIIGKVLNYNGTSPTSGVGVIASVYDGTGKYIGSGSTGVVPQTIPAGQASDFIMNAYIGNMTGNIESADLAVQSLDYVELIEER